MAKEKTNEKAVKECIENGILEEILMKFKAEVERKILRRKNW